MHTSSCNKRTYITIYAFLLLLVFTWHVVYVFALSSNSPRKNHKISSLSNQHVDHIKQSIISPTSQSRLLSNVDEESSNFIISSENCFMQQHVLSVNDLLVIEDEDDVKSLTKRINDWIRGSSKIGFEHDVGQLAEEMLIRMRLSTRDECQPNIFTYNTVMNAYAKQGNPEAVERIMKDMQVIDQLAPDLHSYSSQIVAWSRSCRGIQAAIQAEAILDKMFLQSSISSSEVVPNEVIFSGVVDAWARSGTGDAGVEAERVLRRWLATVGSKFETKKLSRRVRYRKNKSFNVIFNSVINAYAKAGDPASSQRTLRMMKKIGVHPNARSYNIIIKAWTRKSRGRLGAEMAEAVLNSMISDGNVKPNEISFTTVLNAWAKSGEGIIAAEKALSLLDKMVESKIKPNIQTWNTIIDCWAKSHSRYSGKEAENIVRCMNKIYEQTGDVADKPTIFIYNSVLDAWSKSCDPKKAERALSILNELEKRSSQGSSIRPNVVSYATVIGAIAKSDMVDKSFVAESMIERMQSAGVDPNIVVYNSVLNACAFDRDNGKAAYQTARRIMKNLGANANNVTFLTMIRACYNLLESHESYRNAELERLFIACRESGQCCNRFLNVFQQIASQDLLVKLLTTCKVEYLGYEAPEDWSYNVSIDNIREI